MGTAIPPDTESSLAGDVNPDSHRRASSRLAWTAFDQALSSGTNFVLGILVARMVSVKGFGLFTLTYATYQIVLGLGRALVTEPLVVRFSRDDLLDEKGPMRRATGASVLFGAALGALIVIGALFFSGQTRISFLILGLGMPALLLQDCWRFVFFAAGRPKHATLNDAIWTAAQLGLIFDVSVGGTPRVSLLLAAWCGSGVVAALAGLFQARAVPSVRRGWTWVRSTHDLSSRFLVEFVIGNGTSQIMLWLVSLTAGIFAAAALRAAQLLLGPPRVIITAAYSAIVPEGVRFRRRHADAFPMAVVGCAIVLAGCTAVWGVLFLVTPSSVGHALLGDSWKSARPLILILTIGASAFGAQTAAIAALRVLAAANRSLKARAIAAPVSVAATIVGGAVDGARGAALGLAAGQLFSAVITWLQWRAARDPGRGGQLAAGADQAPL